MAGRHRFRRLAALREMLDRGRRARGPVATAPGCTIAFADGPSGIAHRVTDAALPRAVARKVVMSLSAVRRCSR
jgi:hypothetical protein